MTNKTRQIKTLSQLIDHLENAVERSEEAGGCALHLTAEDADDLLPNLKQCLTILYERQEPEDALYL